MDDTGKVHGIFSAFVGKQAAVSFIGHFMLLCTIWISPTNIDLGTSYFAAAQELVATSQRSIDRV